MQCPQCQRKPVERAIFCNYCGGKLEISCAGCRSLNPMDAVACFKCKAPIISAQAGAEKPSRPGSGLLRVSTATLTCRHAHTPHEPGSLYCFECGLPLEGTPRTLTGQPAVGAAAFTGVPAGFWIRALAYAIDGTILTIILSTITPFLAPWLGVDIGNNPLNQRGPSKLDFVGIGLAGTYFTITATVWGTTIGKRLSNLYVVRSDGSRIGPGRALARFLLYFVSGLILSYGFIMIGLRRDKRGLHDLICDTRIVKKF